MARITLKGISKSFKQIKVLKDTNLDVSDGEFLTLVGPSGCGKSTTLRIIAGLESQSFGDVEIDGKVVNTVRPSRRDLAMVFQSYALYPHLSVQQNLVTPLRLRDLSFWERMPIIRRFMPGYGNKVAAIDAAVSEVAETLKIEPLLHRKPGQLSGGQRQRVALGRAMVRKPAAFLMDEPLSNLDAGLRVHMRAELAALHRQLQTTFIYVTHDQAEALTMSDRMAVMMDGVILQIGEPNEVYLNPQDIRVAEFVGSPKINILPGESNSSGQLNCMGVALHRALESKKSLNVSIGVRPEHLQLASHQRPYSISGRVTYKENLGSEIFVYATVNEGSHQVIVRTMPDQPYQPVIGDDIWISWQAERILVFGENGARQEMTAAATLEQAI